MVLAQRLHSLPMGQMLKWLRYLPYLFEVRGSAWVRVPWEPLFCSFVLANPGGSHFFDFLPQLQALASLPLDPMVCRSVAVERVPNKKKVTGSIPVRGTFCLFLLRLAQPAANPSPPSRTLGSVAHWLCATAVSARAEDKLAANA